MAVTAPSVDFSALLFALVILFIPLLLAIPMRLIWYKIVGGEVIHDQYKSYIRKILDSGHTISQFREELDEIAVVRGISKERQSVIETDLLYPLSLPHFLLLPSLIVAPIVLLVATPVFLLALPLLGLVEYVLIRKKILINLIKLIQAKTSWEIVHIPRPHKEHDNLKPEVVAFNRMPLSAFLGLFAWLIVHWIFQGILDWWGIAIICGILYLLLVSLIVVITTVLDTELVIADMAGCSLIPVEKWIESSIKPLVGAGLILLLARDLTTGIRYGNYDPVLFSLSVLSVLFICSLVAIGIEVVYSQRRDKKMHTTFIEQVVSHMSPLSYNFTRFKGLLELQVRGQMALESELIDDLDEVDVDGDDVLELREFLRGGSIDIVEVD